MTDKKTYAKPTVTELGSIAALTLSHINDQGTDAALNAQLGQIGPADLGGGLIIGS